MGKERLKGLNALITGASRGIGRAIALKYADEGADLFLAATKRENLENVATEISSLGRQVFTYELDVSDRKQAVQMVDQAILDLGRIDILINNAGVYKPARFVDYGAFHVLQLVVRNMIKEGTGSVINIASTAGKWGSMNQSAYNTSKHGLVGLTRCVALETAAAGLRVNAICPGFVETDLLNELKTHAEINGMSENEFRELAKSRVPMRRFMKSEEIADLAIFLGSDESSGMTGQSLLIDGGMVLV